ncbi:DUF6599 family protein [Paludibaculum fermentans]|uniref:Uncharacterized protein n=1 Tax=Paludibaculum fermentans TaxID=1473598 RepID=A0A7S7NVD8_PALFE|nr:DUF6599 family protein [Paludibaculum fermentans]QOY90496.1 hypothetical protein IRI77_11245 [Paludibaculum fermentans]
MRAFLLSLIGMVAMGQSPDCSISPGFVQDGKVRQFDTETLYEYMNGNSEGYFLYGFKSMTGITCKKAGVTLIADISTFPSPELAYGMFTGNLDPRLPTEKIGAGGQVTGRKVLFVKGQFLGEIAAEPEGEYTALLRAAAVEFARKITGTTETPAELAWFPKEHLQAGSPRLVPQSVLGLRILKRGYLAQYEEGKSFVVTEDSPASATALFAKLKERFPGGSATQVGDEGYVTEDRYLGKMCLFRKGMRVAGFTNAPPSGDAAQRALQLAARIP